ncbi:MAG: HupE/UreJ family protein [Cyclobacteriaceae bacterium]
MDQFSLYFSIGKDHILDLSQGLDHILYVVALTASARPTDWKKILVLITGFTVGHSVTLALSTLNIISVPSGPVEFLITVTICVTAFLNIFSSEKTADTKRPVLIYGITIFFGLIHGLGFSNMLRALVTGSGSIPLPLFAFNVGLEFGQIIVVAIFTTLAFFSTEKAGINRRDWKMVLSSMIAGMALLLLQDRIDLLFE